MKPNRKSEANAFSFDKLELGALSPVDVKAFVANALSKGDDRALAIRLYESLRVLTGRLLADRLGSEELRAWHSAIDAISAQFDGLDEPWFARMEALAHLLHDRVGLIEARPVEDVLRRQHVRAVLEALGAAGRNTLTRAEIKGALGLEEANLSRVLTLMVDAGLIERHRLGKAALFALSSIGRNVLCELNEQNFVEEFECISYTTDFEPGLVPVRSGRVAWAEDGPVDLHEQQQLLAA